jgi:hypothetical protein
MARCDLVKHYRFLDRFAVSAKTRGAGEGIEPGVERSGTPGFMLSAASRASQHSTQSLDRQPHRSSGFLSPGRASSSSDAIGYQLFR